MIGRDLLEKVINGKRNERVYLCEQEFALFAMYYFAEHFTYAIPGFQWVMYRLLNEFTRGKFRFLLWIMFRESAKTTIAKVYVVYCIAYRKKRFINWDSYDKSNSEQALFDISTWLQTNKRLIADFGQLFFEDPKMSARYSRMKRVGEFITTNRVKVKAYTTQEGTRGRIFDRFRPDLYVVEDFETTKTVESAPTTAKIIRHIDELKSGLSVDGQVIFLGNYISEVGSVAQMLAEAAANPAAWRVQQVAVEQDGEIAWKDKYVRTNEEAAKINQHRPRKQWVVSLEQLRKDLNASGRKVYEAEMMNNPEAAGEPFFDRERIDRDIAKAKTRPALGVVKSIGGLSMFEPYAAKHRYAFGGDTAKGVGRDSCASVGIRFADGPAAAAKVVGTYSSATIAPDLFAYEMKAHGEAFGQCLLAPELNNTGYATVTQLKLIYPERFIYRQVKEEQTGKQISKDLGWEATSANVASIYFAFRSAYENGELEVPSLALLLEMRTFTKRDLETASRKSEVEGVTRHFDLLRAACIAWEMRHYAILGGQARKPYKQGAAESISEYHG